MMHYKTGDIVRFASGMLVKIEESSPGYFMLFQLGSPEPSVYDPVQIGRYTADKVSLLVTLMGGEIVGRRDAAYSVPLDTSKLEAEKKDGIVLNYRQSWLPLVPGDQFILGKRAWKYIARSDNFSEHRHEQSEAVFMNASPYPGAVDSQRIMSWSEVVALFVAGIPFTRGGMPLVVGIDECPEGRETQKITEEVIAELAAPDLSNFAIGAGQLLGTSLGSRKVTITIEVDQ